MLKDSCVCCGYSFFVVHLFYGSFDKHFYLELLTMYSEKNMTKQYYAMVFFFQQNN